MEDFTRKSDVELEISGRTETQIQIWVKIPNSVGSEGYVQVSDSAFN